jgi:hypothetical protein
MPIMELHKKGKINPKKSIARCILEKTSKINGEIN